MSRVPAEILLETENLVNICTGMVEIISRFLETDMFMKASCFCLHCDIVFKHWCCCRKEMNKFPSGL